MLRFTGIRTPWFYCLLLLPFFYGTGLALSQPDLNDSVLADQRPVEARIDKDGYILDWLMLGPMKTSGITLQSAFGEKFCTPNVGHVYGVGQRNLFWFAHHNKVPRINLFKVFPKYEIHSWPSGYPAIAYAHLYILAPQTDCRVKFTGNYSNIEIFLNGMKLPPDGRAAIIKDSAFQPGVNRLLLKIYGYQQKGKPWHFSSRILCPGETLGEGLKLYLNNPEAARSELAVRNHPDFQPGQAPADRIKLGVTNLNCPNRLSTWFEDTPVSQDIMLSYRSDKEMKTLFGQSDYATWKKLTGRAHVQVYDFWGGLAFSKSFPIAITHNRPGRIHLDLGTMERGHYTIRLRLTDFENRLLLNTDMLNGSSHPAPMQFAVISREVNATPQETSKMGASYYWTAGREDIHSDLLRCHLMGARFKLSTRSWYWAGDSPEDILQKPASEWKWNPNIDKALDLAQAFGVEIAGDLDGWWPVKASPAAGTSANKRERDPAVVSCNFDDGRWSLIGRYDEPKAAEIISKYTYECVKRYKDRIRVWKFHNEVNLFRNKGFTPEFYGRLLETAVKAARRADPDCVIVNASLSGSDVNFLDELFSAGYGSYFDIIDIHNYSWGYIGGRKLLTGPIYELVKKRRVQKSIIIGETGHYRFYPANGTLGQAQQLVKWFTWGMTNSWIKKICFGLEGSLYWTVSDRRGAPFPAWVALRTTALLIDGAEYVGRLEKIPLNGYIFRKKDRYVTVLWNDSAKPKQVNFAKEVTLVDIMDRRRKLEAKGPLKLDRTPVFVLGDAGPHPLVAKTGEL